jgi:hypothetical protein
MEYSIMQLNTAKEYIRTNSPNLIENIKSIVEVLHDNIFLFWDSILYVIELLKDFTIQLTIESTSDFISFTNKIYNFVVELNDDEPIIVHEISTENEGITGKI